jgi:hypothetical protein
MAIDDLKVKIGGDASEAEAALGRVSSASSGVSDALQAVGGAIAFDKITSAFKAVLGEASSADLAARRFGATLRGVGSAVDPSRMYALAASLEEVTTFGDDATIAAAGMMGRFGMSQSTIERLIPLTQDLAAAMGEDLSSASDKVAKAVLVGAEGLRGLNLGFGDLEKSAFDAANEQERAGMIAAHMQAQFGGFAQVLGGTATGAMMQFDNAVGNLEEAFGKILNQPIGDAIRGVTGVVRDATHRFEGLSDGSKNAIGTIAAGIGTFGAATAALTTMAGVVGGVARILPAVKDGFDMLGTAAVRAWTGVLAPMLAVAAGIGGAILLIGSLKMAWDGDLGGMRTGLIELTASIKKLFLDAIGFVAKTWERFSDGISDTVITVAGFTMGKSADEVGEILRASRAGGGLLDMSGVSSTLSGAGATASGYLEAGIITGKEALDDTISGFKDAFNAGAGVLGDVLGKFGFDMASFGKHTAAPDAGGGATAARRKATPMDFEKDMHDVMNFTGLQAEFAGVTAEQYHAIMVATGGNVEKSNQMAADFRNASAVAKAAAERTSYYWQSTAGQIAIGNTIAAEGMAELGHGIATLNLDSITSGFETAADGIGITMSAAFDAIADAIIEGAPVALSTMGMGLAQSAGPVGGMITNAMSAGAAGGPAAAVGSVAADIMSQSDSFQNAVAILSDMLGNFAQSLNPLFDALGPLFKTVGIILSLFGSVLNKLFTALQPVFSILAQLLNTLAPIIGLMMIPLQILIAQLNIMKPIFDLLNVVLKVVGDVIRAVATAIAAVYNGIVGFIASIFETIGDILPSWLGGDAIKSFGNRIRSAQVDLTAFNNEIEAASETTHEITKLEPPVEELNKELSNVPSVLKVTRLRLEASMAEGLANELPDMGSPGATLGAAVTNMMQAFGGSQKTDMSRNVHIENLSVGEAAGALAAETVIRALESDAYRMTGSTQASGYPAATPKTTGGY